MNKKIKKVGIVTFILACAFTVGVVTSSSLATAEAQTAEPMATVSATDTDNEVMPLAAIVNFTIDIYTNNGYVIAEAKNQFTFPMATIYTEIKLFSSETYTENVSQMTAEGQNAINDLNMGNVLSTQAAIGGRQIYWRAIVTYKPDSDATRRLETSTYLISPEGNVIY